MKSLTNKLIVYDSNCKVCSSLREVVLKFTSIPEAKVKAYKDLNHDLNKHVDPEKFKNVMALIDTNGGKTIYGAEGVAYILSSQYKIVDFLFRFKTIFWLFNFLYKTQAYNRYIIATPKSSFKCNCFPDRVVKYRVAYIIITLIIAIVLGGCFGLTIKNFLGTPTNKGAVLQMLLMAGTGWVIHAGLAVIILKRRCLDYIGHLGSIMVVGVALLVPWMLWYAITGIPNIYLLALSVVLSTGYMLYLHVVRVRYLELPQALTLCWLILRPSAALLWLSALA